MALRIAISDVTSFPIGLPFSVSFSDFLIVGIEIALKSIVLVAKIL